MNKRLQKAAVVAAVASIGAAAPVALRTPSATSAMSAGHAKAHAVPRRGRPRKFSRPSTSVTLTLPDDVIAALEGVDTDLSRAIVRAVAPLRAQPPRAAAEPTMFGDGSAVILVPPSQALMEHVGVELLPMWDGRAMLAFDGDLSPADLELRIADALDDPGLPPADRATFEALIGILRHARRTGDIAMRQRSIIVLRRARRGRRPRA
jgi:hypothetical protein